MLQRIIEGERVGVDGSKIVDVDHRPDRCPGATRREGERDPLLLLLPWPPTRWADALDSIVH